MELHAAEASLSTREVNARVAHPARVYDYWLGGKDNFEADRIAAAETIAAYPAILSSARANRAFLLRAVRYLAGVHGIRQFVDIGSGLPAAPNTHEVAQSIVPESSIVYVDNDPMVLSHARTLRATTPEGVIAYLDADLRDTATILTQAAKVLNFTKPVAVMLLAILEYIPDLDEARRILAGLRAAIPPGSFLVISHTASDIHPGKIAEMIERMNSHMAESKLVGRPRDAITLFFDGLDLMEPGVVKINQWHPESETESAATIPLWGGVARKPGG
ncbi:MAG: SAM-dependent methyltransferase [Actinobacteria bacterium]|nr:SAM-dependent methyltransferase [Actinomycetota bacterium]